ncbi:hypothetical protein PQX77_016301 [Marasmius sp. AFHP31]|nr:hypothetical protein PQX77_016301 [Marasmius sp. AFHP31]
MDTESRSSNDGDTYMTPYPLPGVIEVVEKQTRLGRKRGSFSGAIVINLSVPKEFGTTIENGENERPPKDIPQLEQSGGITSSRENENAAGQITEPPGGAIFRHTDSGWRPAFQRAASQPFEAESRGVFEMPPTYSEAR